ncbi:MAG: M1 family peptidase [Gammaproteobacteria bacterium]|nr:MAG: M1 family peptidase [Gammaproteobacteria bacterium]
MTRILEPNYTNSFCMKKFLFSSAMLISTFIQAQDIDVLRYRHNLTISDENDTLFGRTTIFFRKLSKRDSIELDLHKISLNGKGMQILSVRSSDEEMPRIRFKQEKEKCFLFPFFNDFPKDTAWLMIEYKGVPEDGLIISKNKFGDRTFFADNWPNRAHKWLPCVDRPDDKASFEFVVTAPSHYSVISNGIKTEEKEVGSGMKLTHWKEDIPSPSKVMVIGAAKFATKIYNDSPKDIPVSAWVYPQDSTKGFYDFAVAPEILKFFSDYIAPFPYKKLANVQSTTIFGGMENASCIFYAENLVTGDRSSEATVAHEVAHQWFGDMASEKSFAHLWLSEGFATYLTNYYWEEKYGKKAASERWKKDREEVIAFATASQKAVVDSTKDLMSLLNANSYQKGAWVLRMFRNEVGDSVFQKIIQTYYNQYKGGNADTRDFEAVAEKVSGKELTWFFDQWLFRLGIPDLQITSKVQNNELTLFVKQRGKPYQLTLDVDLILAGGEVVRKQFEVKTVNNIFKIPVKGGKASFTLDPDVKLLYHLKKQ